MKIVVGSAAVYLGLFWLVWRHFDAASYLLYLAIAVLAASLMPAQTLTHKTSYFWIGAGLSIAYGVVGVWRGDFALMWATLLPAAAQQGVLTLMLAHLAGVRR